MYVHQSCVLHNSDDIDVRQLSGEAKIKAILSLVNKGKGKHCHACTANGAKISAGALLHCAAADRCSRWFHLPCSPQVLPTTDGQGQAITTIYCDDHGSEPLAPTLAEAGQWADADMKAPPLPPSSPVRRHLLAGSPGGTSAKQDASSTFDASGAVPSTPFSYSAADVSSSAGFCQAALQDLVSLLTDRPTAHLDLSYMQTIAEGAIEQLRALLSRGVVAVVVGPNGVGKTTILNLLLFLTAIPNQQYVQEADKMVESKLSALRDKSTEQLYSRFSAALQSRTRGTRLVQRLSPALSSSASSAAVPVTLSSEQVVLLSGLQQSLDNDEQYTSDRLHLLTGPLRVVSEPAAAAGDQDEGTNTAAPEYVCFSLNAKGNTYLSSDKMQRTLADKWERPLREASDRALTPDDILPWLLRSADVGVATTAHICRLLYAPLWHATVHFMTEELAQEVSFNYVAQMLDRYGKQAMRDDDSELRLAKAAYDALVCRPLSSFDWSQCPDITASEVERMLAADESMTSASVRALPQYRQLRSKPGQVSKMPFPSEQSLMPLSAEVQPLLGRALLLKGAGKDFTADREFVRRQLHFWTNCHAARHAILFCSVYAPCTVLTGVELWDTPGMDDRSPIRQWLLQEALQQADVTLCILQRGATFNSTAIDELVRSRVLERKVLSTDEVGHVAFLHYVERGQKHLFDKFAKELRTSSRTADGEDDERDRESGGCQCIQARGAELG